MKTATLPVALWRRTLTSLAAIAAISAIFAVKALETAANKDHGPAMAQVAAEKAAAEKP